MCAMGPFHKIGTYKITASLSGYTDELLDLVNSLGSIAIIVLLSIYLEENTKNKQYAYSIFS